ncbi:MAG: hypothetical protein KDA36_04425 [Planctomycetaceae bacterium]|nr:hypothetical protein [Planctomycetaceae bacterium]
MSQPSSDNSSTGGLGSSLLAQCAELLAAWVDLDRERHQLTQSLYAGRNSPEQISALLDTNEQRRASLMAATELLLNTLKQLPKNRPE